MDLLKNILRRIFPKELRLLIWRIIPKVSLVNTYILKDPQYVKDLYPINDKFIIKEINWKDEEKLKKAHSFRGSDSYERKVPERLNSPEWISLAVFDNTNGDIAYLSWIITRSIKYLEEFSIYLKEGQYLLKDGYCVPDYRHLGLHSRMEQERINFCVNLGATDIFIQILDKNEKGKTSVINNGYKYYQQNMILAWPIFNIYRELFSTIRNPYKKVIK